jgi:hypothetical protein
MADVRDIEPWRELAQLSVRMRRAQIEYFASKNYAALCKAKDLEREFDRGARKLLGVAGEVHQPGSRQAQARLID